MLAKDIVDRHLDLALGNMKRADLVPNLGVAGEIAVRRLGALRADGFGPRRISGEQRVSGTVGPLVDERKQGLDPLRLGERQEHPAALLAPLEHAGVRQNLQMTRNAGLALSQHLGQLTDRQLHQPEQRDDAQPGGIGERLESIGQGQRHGHGIRI